MSKQLFLRSSTLEVGDAGEVTGRIAPFDVEAVVTDRHPDTGQVTKFREVFRRGAFRKMIDGLSARGWTNAVAFNLDHKSDLSHNIGYAIEVEERSDGAWGRFGLYDSNDLPKVKAMLRSSHRGLSVGFLDKKHRSVGDLVERLVVHLDHVAATPAAAYEDALVASVRHSEDLTVPTPRLERARKDLELLRSR